MAHFTPASPRTDWNPLMPLDEDDFREELRQERITRIRPMTIGPSPYNKDISALVVHVSDNTSTSLEMNDHELAYLRSLITEKLGQPDNVAKALAESRARYADLEARAREALLTTGVMPHIVDAVLAPR